MKYLIILFSLFISLTSCHSTYNPPSRYQGKNLVKFDKRKYTLGSSKKKGMKKRIVAFRKSGSYWHPSIPKPVRLELRQRWYSEKIGAGKNH